jgi:hypothetical protein
MVSEKRVRRTSPDSDEIIESSQLSKIRQKLRTFWELKIRAEGILEKKRLI